MQLPGTGLRVAVSREHRLADRTRISVAELAGEPWIAGAGLKGEPQFGAWPTLAGPHLAYAMRDWPARLGLVAAGLGITVVPALAAPAVPAGVVTLPVDDPAWLGRTTVAATREDHTPNADAVVTALRQVAEQLGE
ncbi:hypothetical protein I6J71_17460 [Amycolatopsis sp. FDAARGOS 1241]|nr:LysR substrate-binding domain-containing protein [Amycolatopsis sp. FDAARGOS 1241]QRP49386.1 hypothetical protein I6J71_17460 [Amycolatopsis sp. FDAARGOS 1241]